MLNELVNLPKTVGLKQTLRALREGRALRVYLALDADEAFSQKVAAACREAGVEILTAESSAELGAACGVRIGAATCAVLKPENSGA